MIDWNAFNDWSVNTYKAHHKASEEADKQQK